MQWAAGALAPSWTDDKVRRLAVPWKRMDRVVSPLGGQQIMLIAAPGVGKSTLSLNWAARSGALTLYCSADQDERLTTLQLAALATGHDRQTIETRIVMSSMWRQEYGMAIRSAFPNLVVSFDGNPDMAAIVGRAEALTEVWGVTPELIVLDTVSNVRKSNDGYDGWRKLWLDSHQLARYFNSVVLSAHHVKNGPGSDGLQAPTLDSGKYGSHEFCEIVLGLHQTAPTSLRMTVLKNRGGLKDVSVALTAEHERAAILDPDAGPTIRPNVLTA